MKFDMKNGFISHKKNYLKMFISQYNNNIYKIILIIKLYVFNKIIYMLIIYFLQQFIVFFCLAK